MTRTAASAPRNPGIPAVLMGRLLDDLEPAYDVLRGTGRVPERRAGTRPPTTARPEDLAAERARSPAPAPADRRARAVELVEDGTFTGDMVLPDGTVVPPTGKAFDLDFGQTSKWQGDQLIAISAFWDSALQAKQIGLG